MTWVCGSFLARVDDVVDGVGMAEDRMPGIARSRRRNPAGVGGVLGELLVAEVLAWEETELPEVVCDVLADVGDGTVGADDDLGVFVGCFTSLLLSLDSGAAHDIAALFLPAVSR